MSRYLEAKEIYILCNGGAKDEHAVAVDIAACDLFQLGKGGEALYGKLLGRVCAQGLGQLLGLLRRFIAYSYASFTMRSISSRLIRFASKSASLILIDTTSPIFNPFTIVHKKHQLSFFCNQLSFILYGSLS